MKRKTITSLAIAASITAMSIANAAPATAAMSSTTIRDVHYCEKNGGTWVHSTYGGYCNYNKPKPRLQMMTGA